MNELELDFQVGDEVCLPYDDFFVADGYIEEINGTLAKVRLEYLHNFSECMRATESFRSQCLEFPDQVYKDVELIKLTFVSGSESIPED